MKNDRRNELFNDVLKEQRAIDAINKLGFSHEVKECDHFKTCGKGMYDKCIGCGIWIHKYIKDAPKDISQYDWQSEVINMAETTVNVNIEKKYFTDKGLTESDLEKLSDEHMNIVAALVKKYKEEDTKTWLNKNYPESVYCGNKIQKDFENRICREAIQKFADELNGMYIAYFGNNGNLRYVLEKLGVR